MLPLIYEMRFAVALLTVLLVAGCGDPAAAPDPSVEQWLKSDPSRFPTVPGTIDPGSIQDVGGGIELETEDGQKWTAPYTLNDESGYTFGEVQPAGGAQPN